MARYADDLALAHVLADTADSISVARFRALDLHVTAKPDLTPVTDADTAVEKALRATLARTRPRDPALGRRWWAASGLGAYAGRHQHAATQIHVSGVAELSDASFCYSELISWEE